MKDFEHIAQIIEAFPSDIRAEVLMADLFQNGFLPSDFVVLCKSVFKRGYGRDILKAEKIAVNDMKDMLAIHLSRDGLYDLLPEGLFHTSPEEGITTGQGMAINSKKEAKIEEESRKFFLPFENEFFYQRTLLALQERTILQKLNDSSLDDFFLRFWKIDESLPHKLISKLSAMLPFVKEIVGDFEMTANCLGAILEEEVTHALYYKVEATNETDSDQRNNDDFTLGMASLGVDLISDGHLIEGFKMLRFSIGPLKKTEVDPYLEHGSCARFIDCFCSFFIPIEMDFEFAVTMKKDLQEFVLDSDRTQPIMGYSTVI
ncbi:hypothetical protein [Sediminicola luteus]|uniref:Uncharacterized protein n=1 Tax=Sediminicola luteus TaxID=319238 RepID=A0ABV2TYG5_9FLAO